MWKSQKEIKMNEMDKETILKGMDLSLYGLSLLLVLLGIGYCCFPDDNTQKDTQEINFDQYQQVKEWYDQYPNLKTLYKNSWKMTKLHIKNSTKLYPK